MQISPILKKYGIRDYRGGVEVVPRETAARVAGGAIAKQFLAAKKESPSKLKCITKSETWSFD